MHCCLSLIMSLVLSLPLLVAAMADAAAKTAQSQFGQSSGYLDALARLADADSRMLSATVGRTELTLQCLQSVVSPATCASCCYQNHARDNWCINCGTALAHSVGIGVAAAAAARELADAATELTAVHAAGLCLWGKTEGSCQSLDEQTEELVSAISTPHHDDVTLQQSTEHAIETEADLGPVGSKELRASATFLRQLQEASLESSSSYPLKGSTSDTHIASWCTQPGAGHTAPCSDSWKTADIALPCGEQLASQTVGSAKMKPLVYRHSNSSSVASDTMSYEATSSTNHDVEKDTWRCTEGGHGPSSDRAGMTRHWETSKRYAWRTPSTLRGPGGPNIVHGGSPQVVGSEVRRVTGGALSTVKESAALLVASGTLSTVKESAAPLVASGAAEVELVGESDKEPAMETELSLESLTSSLSDLSAAQTHVQLFDDDVARLPYQPSSTVVPTLRLESLEDNTVDNMVDTTTEEVRDWLNKLIQSRISLHPVAPLEVVIAQIFGATGTAKRGGA